MSLVLLCWCSHLVWLSQLVLEVVQQLQRMFQPDIKQIKKRIEDLIQREFLVRFCCWDPNITMPLVFTGWAHAFACGTGVYRRSSGAGSCC